MTHVVLVGSPTAGFTVVGPYPSHAAATEEIDWACSEYGDPLDCECWDFELQPPDEGAHPAGAAIVFAGDICGDPETGEGWRFYGPFRNLEAARAWAAEDGLGSDCAIVLQPVKKLEAA
jgi:hypothetical protein